MRSGDVAVSRVHANFFINEGKGTASDYLRLMDMVSEKVKERFNVVLEPEIRVIGKGRS
jgi:UDP-N-acetylmuramate dehydrogenase